MQEQYNENNQLSADFEDRKKWVKPVLVELDQANGGGAEGKLWTFPTEGRFGPQYGPS